MTDVPANLSTTESVDEGVSYSGEIDFAGDEDWIAVTFEEGVTYGITLKGLSSGVGTLEDPFITGLYDADGVSLGLSDDDGAGSRESLLVYTADYSGVYYVSAGAWSTLTGTYELNYGVYEPEPQTAESGVPIEEYEVSGNDELDALLTLIRFKDYVNDGITTVSYSIPTSGSVYSEDTYGPEGSDSEPWSDISYLTNAEIALFEDGLAQIEAFANIEFEELADDSTSAGTIRPAWTGMADDSAAAWAYTPFSDPSSGDIWLLLENLGTGGVGSYFHLVLLHELGHAVGLKHPFDTDGSGVTMSSQYDGLEYTLMSYNSSVEGADIVGLSYYPTTYMYYDILALQHVYGAVENADGNTRYSFVPGQTYYETIWDTGGTDTYDASALAADVTLDLRPGTWSDVGSIIYMYGTFDTQEKTDTVYTPPEITIERALGGSGDDELYGNSAGNVLAGNAGDDRISGGGGADRLQGNAGDDTLAGGSGNDALWAGSGDAGNDRMEGGDGADTVGGGKGDDFLIGGLGSDVLYGGLGDDTLYSGLYSDDAGELDDTADRLWSGSGDDNIYGSAGSETIGTGMGNDYVEAGNGGDTIYGGGFGDDTLFGEAGADLIFGGDGDDVLDGGLGADEIYGGTDDDRVNGGGAGDRLFGGKGDDTLIGGGGSDTLTGSAGDDTLRPGAGADVLVFASGSGEDVVSGFETEDDTLDLSATTTDFTNLASVQAAASNTAGGLLIDLGGGDSLLLADLTLDDLTSFTLILD
jgi:serralysin